MPAGGLLTAAAIAGGVNSLFKIGEGISQNAKANKIARTNKRPWMEIPSEVSQGLNNAKYVAAQTKLPGQDLIEQKIGSSFANYANALEKVSPSTGTTLNDLSMGYQNNLNKLADLGIAGAENWQQNQGVLRNELNNMADWQQKKFMYNFDEPYRIKAATASALKGAGMQNINAGITDAAGTVANYANMNNYANMKSMDNSFDSFLEGLNKPNPVSIQEGNITPSTITTQPVGYGQGTPVEFTPKTTAWYNWDNFIKGVTSGGNPSTGGTRSYYTQPVGYGQGQPANFIPKTTGYNWANLPLG